MKRHLIVVLAILASGPLGLVLAWPLIAGKLRTADLSLALVTQPHDGIVVSGYLHNHEAAAFSLESLSIEEPLKKPYRRQVALDENRTFELALGAPQAGSYEVAVWTRKANWLTGDHERWLRAPALVIKEGEPLVAQKVSSQDYNYVGLLQVAFATIAAQMALLVAWWKIRRGVVSGTVRRTESQMSPSRTTPDSCVS